MAENKQDRYTVTQEDGTPVPQILSMFEHPSRLINNNGIVEIWCGNELRATYRCESVAFVETITKQEND